MAIKKLTDPEIEEVSLVDHGANLRTFMFVKNAKNIDAKGLYTFDKADTNIKIESNGSVEGTNININGEEIDPISFNFSMYNYEGESFDNDLYVEFAVEDKGVKGEFSNVQLFRLQKARPSEEVDQERLNNVKKSTSNIQDYLKEENLSHLGEDGVVNLAKSLDVLADYKILAPPDVLEALNIVTDIAVNKSNEQGEEEKEIEKEKEEPMTDEEKKIEEAKKIEDEKAEALKEEARISSEENAAAESNNGREELDVETLVASITEKVTTNVTAEIATLLDEKLKTVTVEADEDEEIEVSEEDLMAVVDEVINR